MGAALANPLFTKGRSQLSQREVETSRELSHVRIHVEQAIGKIKHFKLLQQTWPIPLLKSTDKTDFASTDKVFIVCAALCNLLSPLA